MTSEQLKQLTDAYTGKIKHCLPGDRAIRVVPRNLWQCQCGCHGDFTEQTSAAQSAPAGERETIRAVFLRNGFTVKEGQTDLKPYVYAAAEELLSIARAAWQRAQGAVPHGFMPIPTAEQLAKALENVRSFHDMSAELIAPELLTNLLASTGQEVGK